MTTTPEQEEGMESAAEQEAPAHGMWCLPLDAWLDMNEDYAYFFPQDGEHPLKAMDVPAVRAYFEPLQGTSGYVMVDARQYHASIYSAIRYPVGPVYKQGHMLLRMGGLYEEVVAATYLSEVDESPADVREGMGGTDVVEFSAHDVVNVRCRRCGNGADSGQLLVEYWPDQDWPEDNKVHVCCDGCSNTYVRELKRGVVKRQREG